MLQITAQRISKTAPSFEMSEGYREETQSEVDMTEPHGVQQITAPGDFGDYPADHNAELDMDNFIWEDVLEEIGRFENFDVDMTFSLLERSSFSQHLRAYIMARRILSKVSNESNPGLTLHKVNLDATPIGDVNVTRRSIHRRGWSKNQWSQATKRLALQCKE